MANMVLEFSPEETMRIEAILMDNDAEDALRFLKEVIGQNAPMNWIWVNLRVL